MEKNCCLEFLSETGFFTLLKLCNNRNLAFPVEGIGSVPLERILITEIFHFSLAFFFLFDTFSLLFSNSFILHYMINHKKTWAWTQKE